MSNTLPQLDTTYYISQFFWLLVSFTVLCIFVKFYFLPKIQDLFESRKMYIQSKQKELEDLQAKLASLKETYDTSLIQIQQQAEEFKKNAVNQFDNIAKKEMLENKKRIEKILIQSKKDINNWEKNISSDIESVGFENIKSIVNKALGIDAIK